MSVTALCKSRNTFAVSLFEELLSSSMVRKLVVISRFRVAWGFKDCEEKSEWELIGTNMAYRLGNLSQDRSVGRADLHRHERSKRAGAGEESALQKRLHVIFNSQY